MNTLFDKFNIYRKNGFTLIDSLVMVILAAILAVIIVPHYTTAQTNSKVSRVQSDLRNLAAAIETYQVDFNYYPYPPGDFNGSGHNNGAYDNWTWEGIPKTLTTPIAYLPSNVFWDPFVDLWNNTHSVSTYRYESNECLIYNITFNSEWWWDPQYPVGITYYSWIYGTANIRKRYVVWSNGPDDYSYTRMIYDPTNGLTSNGDIYRWGP